MTGGGNLVRNERYRKTPRTPKSTHARYYYTRSLVEGSPVRRRPNTPRSRCQSAPKVMDSHSRSASPREPARPQHRPPSPPSSPQSGFDNRAYQHDESDPNHNDSFTSNGPHPNHQNGHTKEPNGDTKTLEAVNLELINLTPKNGSKKKDVEVDMNSTNPYDEYFVPVNEHRKYMRGEKLYVTADKRGEKGGCKRPLCWTLLALVVVAIVALIVLAATGILFTNSPTPLEQYNASVSSARAFGGITSDRNDDHDHDHSNHHHDHSDHDHHEQEQSTTPPQLGTETQSDEAQLPPISEESSDTSMYVPRTLEGTVKIDNEIFTPDLEDTESEKYRDFTMSFSDALKHALFDRNTLENGDNEIMVEVIQIRNGSLIVTYRIHWIPKHNAEPSEEMTATALKTNLNNYLNDNNRMINVYHVADEEIPTTQVLDLCKINNFECEYKCEFDDSTLDFMCVCPPGQIVDMRAPKRCMTLLENSDQGNPETTAKKETNVLNYNSNESSMPSSSEEKVNTEKVSSANEESIFDWKEPHHYTPETTTETEPDLNFSHIFGPDTPKPEPEPNAEPEVIPMAEPTLTPKPEDDADSNIEPKPEPTAEPQAEPTPEPSAEPNPEPEPAPEPNSEPALAPEPTALPEPESKPEPTAEQKPDSEPTSGPTAEPKPEPEPTAEPNPEPEPTTSPNTDPQSIAEPEPGSSTETQQEQESIAEPQPEVKTVTEQELSQRPQPGDASTSSTETTVSSVTMIPNKEILISRENTKQDESTEPNATSKQTIMFDHPTFDLDSIIGLHTTAEPETSENTESNLAIRPLENSENANENMEKKSPTTMRISLSEPHIINEPSYEPKPEIISILMENGRRMNFTSIDATNYTTPENDWLEAEDENNNMSSETTTRNVNDQMDSEMQNEGSSEHVNRTEQRSSKKFEDLAFESTTDSINENNSDDITFDLIKKNNEMTSVPTTMEPNIEKTEDTSDVATLNKNNFETTTFTTTYPSKMDTQQEDGEVKEILVENNTELITQNKADTKLNHTTPTPEYSINKQFEGSEADQNLIEVLNINNTSNKMFNVTTTENDLPDESKDVTFDNISMLYNRSSKSIEKEENTNLEVTESTEESGENTTDSDWLSESVAEVNYEDVMNKIEKQDTTETSPSKIDEIMGRGITKDDFEPDYLNNMGSKTTKMSEQDVPLYGMSQDYDNEDSRFKRVNMDKDKSDVNTKNNRTEAKQEMAINSEIETTTIGQYIYKVSQQNMNESLANSESSSTTPKPAPVWEESESEGMDDLTVKELPKQNVHDKVDGISITSTALPLTTTSTNLKQFYQDNSTSMSELMPQNTTAVNNLNVTIYEISSHSGNQSFLSLKPTNSPSTEFVDHETEMNPFLPEVENNKSLVKKLQEGHDLEPTSLNETQNENVEEHIPSNPDIISSVVSNQATENNETHSSNTTLLVTPETDPETTTEQIEDEDFLFNQLFTNSHEQESEFTTEVNKMFPSPTISNKDRTITTETNENKEVLPISTFLLDTDDLDTTKKPSTLTESDLNLSLSNEQMTSDPIKDTNSEFLSVVPIIEQENFMQPLQKNYNSESSQELNYISDSPKKSDRRTIDVNNLDSVINNVA